MKKLMFAAVAIAAGAALADVTSANVVGYAPAALQNFGLTAGSCFVPVGGGKVDLADLIVTGYKDEQGEGEAGGEVNIQTLNEFGQTQESYFWYDMPSEDILGWIDIGDNPYEGGVKIQAGEGLWTSCTGDGFNLQSSGEVPQSGVEVELQNFGLSVANATPVQVDLINCIVTGYKDEQGEGEAGGEVNVQTLNEFGQTVGSYFWYDMPGEDILGWIDIGDNPLEEGDVPVEPGAGLWTSCSGDGFNFVWPGVEIK